MSEADLILLVEDSPTQAAHMQFILEDAGFRVSVAVNGLIGLERVRAEQPLLVVTDLHMPEMNGLELVEQLRQKILFAPRHTHHGRWYGRYCGGSLAQRSRQLRSQAPCRNDVGGNGTADPRAIDGRPHGPEKLVECQTSSDLTFSLYNDDSLLPAVVARIRDQLQEMGICDHSGLMPVSTALDEALVNAMIHGNLEVSSALRVEDGGKPYRNQIIERRETSPYRERRVNVHLTTTREEAKVVIRDEGPGFDPAKIPDPTDPANIGKVSGRGLLLIHTFMDEVRHNEQGNEITMIKRRNVAPI